MHLKEELAGLFDSRSAPNRPASYRCANNAAGERIRVLGTNPGCAHRNAPAAMTTITTASAQLQNRADGSPSVQATIETLHKCVCICLDICFLRSRDGTNGTLRRHCHSCDIWCIYGVKFVDISPSVSHAVPAEMIV